VQHNRLGIPWGRGTHLSRVSGPIVSNNLSDEEKANVLLQLIGKLPNISFAFTISEHAPNAYLIRQAFKYAGFECFEQLNYSQDQNDVINRPGRKLDQVDGPDGLALFRGRRRLVIERLGIIW
jgi:hypothetical protein